MVEAIFVWIVYVCRRLEKEWLSAEPVPIYQQLVRRSENIIPAK